MVANQRAIEPIVGENTHCPSRFAPSHSDNMISRFGSTSSAGAWNSLLQKSLTIAPHDAYISIRRSDMASKAARAAVPVVHAGLQTFSGEGDRHRLTGTAVKAVLRLISAWGGSNAEGATLLGVSESTWDRMKSGKWDGVLSQDQMTRASALIGVFKGLHLLFADDMADRWPRLVNRGPIFDRRAPIHAMMEGGIPRMLETRQYIDALRGGL
ncbi:antitoxin Xre-like helix-turn-helix domain-containing protein [Sphingobium aromaticiconvertens]|uniref:antitoxin Xre-like helix-turn-helix domain-containing protein n=1 Tax=Sphingobium aromaticiconvertens TaxID=365341 RepID=UPI00301AC4E7